MILRHDFTRRRPLSANCFLSRAISMAAFIELDVRTSGKRDWYVLHTSAIFYRWQSNCPSVVSFATSTFRYWPLPPLSCSFRFFPFVAFHSATTFSVGRSSVEFRDARIFHSFPNHYRIIATVTDIIRNFRAIHLKSVAFCPRTSVLRSCPEIDLLTCLF